MTETHLVKRRGHKEKFDEKKSYASVFWACKSSHLEAAKCELISGKVTKSLKEHLKNKKEIDSNEIFEFICLELEKHHKDSAYMYKTHRDIS